MAKTLSVHDRGGRVLHVTGMIDVQPASRRSRYYPLERGT
jgi:hypothetical protein